MSWSVYLLFSSAGTYVGATVDLDRRLRQHNGELSGGAKATSRCEGWVRACHVEGFTEERSALQFEWAWKNRTKKFKSGTPLQRRFKGLLDLVTSEKATSGAIPFAQLEEPLCLVLETPISKQLWTGLNAEPLDHLLIFEKE